MRRVLTLAFAFSIALLAGCGDQPQQPAAVKPASPPVAPAVKRPAPATSGSAVAPLARATIKSAPTPLLKTAPAAHAQTASFAPMQTAPVAIAPPPPPARAAAEPGAAAEELTCALIPGPALQLPESVVMGMLAVQLSDVPRLALVERTEVDRVLKEQALQLAFAPEGVKERRSLGTLLKARLLLLMRAGERKVDDRNERWIDLSICDTDSGLRIGQQTVRWDDHDSPDFAARTIVQAVKQARERLAAPVKTLVAVPPLTSDDLLHRYDAMQEAYARLVESCFMRLPGVQVVELAEARAVLAEQQLAAAGAVRRSLTAFFITGRYRNNGEGAARRVNIAFDLKQGDKLLDHHENAAVEPGREGAIFTALGRKWLGLMQLQAGSDFNPRKEITVLLPQAGVLSSLGDYEHALSLHEAALLLSPTDQFIRMAAITDCARIANASFYSPQVDPKGYAGPARHGLEAALHGCEHLEQFLARGEDHKWNDGKPLASLPDYDEMHPSSLHRNLELFWRAGKNIIESRERDPEVRRLVTELGKAKRELMLTLYERMAARGQTNMADYWREHEVVYDERTDALAYSRTTRYDQIDYVLFDCTPSEEPLGETFQARLRAINLCRKMLGAEALPFCEIYATYHLPLADPAYAQFLGQLAALSGDAGWKKLVGKLRLRADVEVRQKRVHKDDLDHLNLTVGPRAAFEKAGTQKAVEPAATPKAGEAAPPPALREPAPRREAPPQAAAPRQAAREAMPPQSPTDEFRLVPLRELDEVKTSFSGWIPAGRSADLLWTRMDLYIMRQKGKLEPLYHTGEIDPWTNTPTDPIRRVAYDGQYAWVVQNDRLMVIDPESGATARIDAKAGLPPGEMLAAPLAPGRVCVVGATERAWCATVDFAFGRKTRIDIFHEARLQTGAWDDPRLAFRPSFAVTVRGDAAISAPRVLVGRYCVGRASHLALLLDPARRTAEVVPGRVSNMLRPSMLAERDGSVWWIEHNADRLAVDYITQNKDKPAPPQLDEENLARISARNVAEAKARGKTTRSVMVSELGIETEDRTPQPNKPFTQLVRFGPPSWRPEVMLNNAVEAKWYDESGGPWDRVKHMVGFLDGRCYAIDALNNCWWLDLERGRSVQLRGFLKGSSSEAWKRLFQSNHYGLVLQDNLEGVPGVRRFQFVPLFEPEALRAAIDHGNASRREVRRQDPLQLRQAVLRCYQDWRQRPGDFTTMTAPIDGEAVMVEPQALREHSVVALVGGEQPDPEVRKLLRQTVLMFNYGGDEAVRFVKSRDAARFFRLDRQDLAQAPGAPKQVILQDALGRPLAGAEVSVTYGSALSWTGAPFEDLHFALPRGKTDAQGGFSFPLQWQSTNMGYGKMPMQIEVRHPAYGAARIENWLANNGGDPMEKVTVRLPLAAREDAAHALRGAVVDAAGKPVAGAMVWCDRALDPSGHALSVKPFRVFCDREGRFCFYPVVSVDYGSPPMPLVAGMRFFVKIKDPARPQIPSCSLVLGNDRERVIRWDDGLRRVRFVVKDETGKTLDARGGGFNITYQASPEARKLIDELEIPLFTTYEPYSDELAMRDVMTSATLKRIGWYDVRAWDSLGQGSAVQIAPDGPPEVVVTITKNKPSGAPARPAPASFLRSPGAGNPNLAVRSFSPGR